MTLNSIRKSVVGGVIVLTLFTFLWAFTTTEEVKPIVWAYFLGVLFITATDPVWRKEK